VTVETLFRLEKVGMVLGGVEVLRGITFEVYRGEIFALMGPSGVGKSTLLRLMNLFEKPTAGRLLFRGEGIEEGGRKAASSVLRMRRRMSLVFQQPYLFDTSVFRNVAFGLEVRATDREAIREKVQRALGIVGLSPLATRNARTLSGGEAQRVAFARAIVYEPEVLLLDEPTANLDPRNVASMEGIIRRANRELGTTIVLATHNLNQVRRLADRVAFLLDGEVLEVGTTEKIFEAPHHRQTLEFIRGEMIY
jgi:tungstate transport system ATP-binding protein